MACGLFLANLLEAMRWTHALGRVARPLARCAHLSAAAASAFALAFVSPAAANALLSEKFNEGQLPLSQLLLANLFNGLPAYFAHTPAIFLLIWPVLGFAALIYVGITLVAAIGRTAVTILLGRMFLPQSPDLAELAGDNRTGAEAFGRRLRGASEKAWLRFRKRLPRLLAFTIPVYLIMLAAQHWGFFRDIETWLAGHLQWLAFIKPQAVGIIAMQLLAEMGATLGAASAALSDGSLDLRDVVIAMLTGNVLATPLRAIRHQLPVYAGFFRPRVALILVVANQSLRAASMIIAIGLYVWLA